VRSNDLVSRQLAYVLEAERRRSYSTNRVTRITKWSKYL